MSADRGIADYDIVIAGGGLVGAAFAAAFCQAPGAARLRVALVERQAPLATGRGELFDPRVVAITEASRRLLMQAGAWDDSVALRACPYRHMEVRDGEGTGLIRFDSHEIQQPDLGHIVENTVLLGALLVRLREFDNLTFIHHSIARVTPGRPSEIVLDDGSCLRTPLLVAADGANSLVREQSGFRVRSWDYGHDAIVATIATAMPHGYTAFQWFNTTGPLAFLPLLGEGADCHHCSIVWSQDRAQAQQLLALDERGFIEALSRTSERRLGDVLATSRRYSFPIRQRHAVDYVTEGVVLIGDAAHSIHPLAGQGVNLGFGDAQVLVEELGRALARGLSVGHPSALGRYQRRRKPDNLAMMAAMEGFKRLFGSEDPVLRVVRNRGMSGLDALGPVKNRLVRRAMGF
ncbi:MAG: UbiH/UbiF/VisC/COQ6 family ubiquinone biosynthesis hydroxylase [Porticoccaceae bacterium]